MAGSRSRRLGPPPIHDRRGALRGRLRRPSCISSLTCPCCTSDLRKGSSDLSEPGLTPAKHRVWPQVRLCILPAKGRPLAREPRGRSREAGGGPGAGVSGLMRLGPSSDVLISEPTHPHTPWDSWSLAAQGRPGVAHPPALVRGQSDPECPKSRSLDRPGSGCRVMGADRRHQCGGSVLLLRIREADSGGSQRGLLACHLVRLHYRLRRCTLSGVACSLGHRPEQADRRHGQHGHGCGLLAGRL